MGEFGTDDAYLKWDGGGFDACLEEREQSPLLSCFGISFVGEAGDGHGGGMFLGIVLELDNSYIFRVQNLFLIGNTRAMAKCPLPPGKLKHQH